MSNQLNFSQQMDEVLKTLGDTDPRLLLHACCGPCSSAVLERLCRYFDITVLYYKPQHMARRRIPPPGRRAGALRRRRPPAGGDGGGRPVRPAGVLLRCRGPRERAGARQPLHGLLSAADAPCGPVCRRARLRLVHHDPLHQPHKDAKRINAIGQELEQEYGVRHLPSDFKKQNGYLRSLQLSEEYGLYRQDYCGCEFSAKARGIE